MKNRILVAEDCVVKPFDPLPVDRTGTAKAAKLRTLFSETAHCCARRDDTAVRSLFKPLDQESAV